MPTKANLYFQDPRRPTLANGRAAIFLGVMANKRKLRKSYPQPGSYVHPQNIYGKSVKPADIQIMLKA